MKAWIAVFTVFMLLAVCQVVAGEESTIVKISPADQTVSTGESFTVEIVVEPATAIAGAQFDLRFDPMLLSVTSVTEGNLFSQGGASTYLQVLEIDNENGLVQGVAGVITTPGATVSSPGTFVTVHFIAKTTEGISSLTLESVIVGDSNGVAVSSTGQSGSVTISAQSPTPEGEISTTIILTVVGAIIAVVVVLMVWRR